LKKIKEIRTARIPIRIHSLIKNNGEIGLCIQRTPLMISEKKIKKKAMDRAF